MSRPWENFQVKLAFPISWRFAYVACAGQRGNNWITQSPCPLLKKHLHSFAEQVRSLQVELLGLRRGKVLTFLPFFGRREHRQLWSKKIKMWSLSIEKVKWSTYHNVALRNWRNTRVIKMVPATVVFVDTICSIYEIKSRLKYHKSWKVRTPNLQWPPPIPP